MLLRCLWTAAVVVVGASRWVGVSWGGDELGVGVRLTKIELMHPVADYYQQGDSRVCLSAWLIPDSSALFTTTSLAMPRCFTKRAAASTAAGKKPSEEKRSPREVRQAG